MNQSLLSWDGEGRGIEDSVNQSWDGEGRDGEKINHDEEIVAMVLLEMFLSFSGILSNLLVVTTVRHHDQLMSSTVNLLLLNLCFSNLLISFLVKPISAIYGGYSISTGSWQVSLVFCSLYTLIYRVTLCILPFTIISLSSLHLLPTHLQGLSVPVVETPPPSPPSSLFRNSPRSSTPSPYYPGLSPEPAPPSPQTKRRLAELSDDLTLKQKLCILGIWIFSAFYGIATCFPEKIFGVELLRDTQIEEEVGSAKAEEMTVCNIKSGLNDFLDYISLVVCLVLPTILGPFLLLVLSPFFVFQKARGVPSLRLLIWLSLIYIISYSFHLVISESLEVHGFVFLVLKNLVGFLFLVAAPIIIIILQDDIRGGLRPLFQSKIICPPDENQEDQAC
ncbi:uncharacterized protein LOC111715979 [Eurytemora carolleeae]|uniref:uncharacterized protein LOC111715979 n=1 Tax=Eurytemora carolleeae TaxID=1294199 RepID=UPI000C767B5A|nr:uncharacterized protein LOC111715979 [Eurytemora carolleeae]|eukprot:XP_023347187.1 uncharacterized protein LOC111715979 [Eurytemora affinis]